MNEEFAPMSSSGVAQGQVFPSTPWSLIVESQQAGDPHALAALDRLVRIYWRPLVMYARSTGLDETEAQDEVQHMFQQMLARDSLRAVLPGETRFRSFLIKCLRNTMVSNHRQDHRRKRGGGVSHEPLEAARGIEQTAYESPERALDRAWAAAVFEHAFEQLRLDAKTRGRERQMAVLEPLLRGRADHEGYAALAVKLDTSEGTVRKMVFDLRARLGALIRQQVTATVADPSEVDEELRHLLSLL